MALLLSERMSQIVCGWRQNSWYIIFNVFVITPA